MANHTHREYPGQAAAFVVVSVGCLLALVYVFGDSIQDTAKELFDLTGDDLFMIPIGAAGFVLFWRLLDKTLFVPVIKVIEERESLTSGAEVSAASAKSQTAELEAEYEEKLTAARIEGMQIKARTLGEARRESQQIIDTASEASLKELSLARQEIEKESQALKDVLLADSQELVDAVVEKVTTAPEAVKSLR